MTDKQIEMKLVHGSPYAFADACEFAADTLVITTAECRAAIEKYNREWTDAGNLPIS